MIRFPPLKTEEWSPDQGRVAADIISGPRGQLRGPFIPLMYSPGLASSVQKLGEYLRFSNRLPDTLIEIAVLVTARHFHCPNIWQSHRALALKAGVNPAIIAAIAAGNRPIGLSADEATVFDFCSELVDDIAVSDKNFERVVALWDRPTAIDLTGLCGYYTLLAMILNTAQIPIPDGAVPFEP